MVEVELDKEQGDSQEEEGGTQEGSQEEKESQTQEESSGEDSEDSVGRKRKGDSQSTLTSEDDLENEQTTETTTKPLRPIPMLVDSTVLLPASNTTFDLDPLGIKAMKATLAATTRSKGPKGPRKQKAITPLKR